MRMMSRLLRFVRSVEGSTEAAARGARRRSGISSLLTALVIPSALLALAMRSQGAAGTAALASQLTSSQPIISFEEKLLGSVPEGLHVQLERLAFFSPDGRIAAYPDGEGGNWLFSQAGSRGQW